MRLTRNLVLAGITVGVGILGWVLPPTAWAQTPLPEQAEQDQWSFRPGAIELGAQIGGGFSLANTTRDATAFALLPRLGYVFAQQEHFLPGSFEIVIEPTYLTVFQHQTVHVGGLAALLKYNFRTGTRWTPYLVGGAGVSFASHRLPHGHQLQFPPGRRPRPPVRPDPPLAPRGGMAVPALLQRGHLVVESGPQPGPLPPGRLGRLLRD